MIRRPGLATLLLAVSLAASPAVLGQQAGQGQQQGEGGTRGEDDQASQGLSEEGLETPSEVENIDEILRGEEEVFGTIGDFTYDPGERRDPFRSLLVSFEPTEGSRPRPEGIPGLLIDEINLIGIWKTPRGFIAQVQASDKQKSFALHLGEQLYDGHVLSISENEVVFRQIVRQDQDPTAEKPFRDRVKVLNPN